MSQRAGTTRRRYRQRKAALVMPSDPGDDALVDFGTGLTIWKGNQRPRPGQIRDDEVAEVVVGPPMPEDLAVLVPLDPRGPRTAPHQRVSQIYVMGRYGGSKTNLTQTPTAGDIPHGWSPGGARILYQISTDIWVMNADGSNQKRIYRGGDEAVRSR